MARLWISRVISWFFIEIEYLWWIVVLFNLFFISQIQSFAPMIIEDWSLRQRLMSLFQIRADFNFKKYHFQLLYSSVQSFIWFIQILSPSADYLTIWIYSIILSKNPHLLCIPNHHIPLITSMIFPFSSPSADYFAIRSGAGEIRWNLSLWWRSRSV